MLGQYWLFYLSSLRFLDVILHCKMTHLMQQYINKKQKPEAACFMWNFAVTQDKNANKWKLIKVKKIGDEIMCHSDEN